MSRSHSMSRLDGAFPFPVQNLQRVQPKVLTEEHQKPSLDFAQSTIIQYGFISRELSRNFNLKKKN